MEVWINNRKVYLTFPDEFLFLAMAASKVSVVVKTIRSLTDRKLSHNIFTPVSEKGRYESRDVPRRRRSWESAQTLYGPFEIERPNWNERKALLKAVFKEEKEPVSEKIGTNRSVALTKKIDSYFYGNKVFRS